MKICGQGARIVRDQRGQVTVLVAVMALGLLALVGLVADGGSLFAARRDLQGLADGAARSGAMAVDLDVLRSSGGSRIVLSPSLARDRAERYLDSSGFEGSIEVETTQRTVMVRLSEQEPTGFLRIVGVTTFGVTASATASPRHGIEEPTG